MEPRVNTEIRVGADENGLGPRLGPLVVTAVTIEVNGTDARRLARAGRAAGIGDSKEAGAFELMAETEGVVLGVLGALGMDVSSDVGLLRALSLEPVAQIQARCPAAGGAFAQCWREALTLPVFGGDAARGRAAVARLARAGCRVVRARSAYRCVARYNDFVRDGTSKLLADLEAMEELLLDARAAAAVPVVAHCGMVGGIRGYRDRFRRLSPERVAVVRETRRAASYEVEELGRVTFEVDAEARHVEIALASMIGKYVRELAMERQNRFYAGLVDGLEPASGYYDPVTTRFIAATALVRRERAIAAECFERLR